MFEPANDFHIRYYESQVWKKTYWLGVPVQKLPLDLWVYQEIIRETSPDLIVETGTLFGGSALFMANICDLLGKGEVITVDVVHRDDFPNHPRITYLTGSSVCVPVLKEIRKRAEGKRTMVVFDSDHFRDHVLAEMREYSPMVTKGCYMIVEDTDINGHPVLPNFGPGPKEAVDLFLAENKRFVPDAGQEKFFLTFHPDGYLLAME